MARTAESISPVGGHGLLQRQECLTSAGRSAHRCWFFCRGEEAVRRTAGLHPPDRSADPLATTGMQTLWAAQISNAARGIETPIRIGSPKETIDKCRAFRSDGEIARVHWLDADTGAK